MKIKKIAFSLLLGGLVMNSAVLANHCQQMKEDDRLNKAVDKTIDRYEDLDDDVSFKVKDSCVTLTGMVDNSAEKQQAGQLVFNIDGVKEVHNKLEVENSY